ncbi:MAG: hypothetical protein NTY39_12690 [Campylobacterales bacterium]|nr:hypothetical protein [Campylobacterales bacterium]
MLRLNKLEVIQNLPKIKPLQPLNRSKTKIEIGVSDIDILCLIADINYKSFLLLEDNPPSVQLNAIIDNRLNMVGKLFKMMDNHVFVSKREYKAIKQSMSIKLLK